MSQAVPIQQSVAVNPPDAEGFSRTINTLHTSWRRGIQGFSIEIS
jgi:hypothetical protein